MEILTIGGLVIAGLFLFANKFYKNDEKKRLKLELRAITLMAQILVFAWTGAIRYHGVLPPKKENQIFVANHSTMLDYALLLQMRPFCVVGQLHDSTPLIRYVFFCFFFLRNCAIFFCELQQFALSQCKLAQKKTKN